MQKGTRSGFELSESRLDVSRLRQDLKHPQTRFLITLEGHVNPEYQEKLIERMDCEAYESLAQAEGAKIIQDTLAQFEILDAIMVQRVGRLVVGEPFYWIGVTSASEDAAYQASQSLLQQLKSKIPIWCKVYFKDGSSVWCQEADQPMHQTAEIPTVSMSTESLPEKNQAPSSSVNLEASLSPQVYYQSQLELAGLGLEGQQALANARVLVIGAGGLGCAALSYLAGAGVGTVGLCDFARLKEGHLNRQPLYDASSIGKNKAILAAERLRALNPFIHIQVYPKKVERHNVQGLFNASDLILDCSDHLNTMTLLNEAAVAFKKPLIQAWVSQYEGQLHLYQPDNGSCLRCQDSKFQPNETNPPSSNSLGAVTGILGAMQALEAIKQLVHLPTPLKDYFLTFNLLAYQSQLIPRQKNPECPICQSYKNRVAAVLKPTDAENAEPTVPDWAIFINPGNEAMLSEFILVDVSETREHTQFPGHPCLNLPFSRFDLNNPMLDRHHQYLLYCQKGTRSMHLVRELRRRGYSNLYALAGGFARMQTFFNTQTAPQLNIALEPPAAVSGTVG